jgi:protein-disulfide isomerase
MKNKSLIAKVLAVVLLAFTIIIVFVKQNESPNKAQVTVQDPKVYVRDHSPKFGENKKNVTIVEFLDPQCPSCAYFHPAVKKIMSDYGEEVQLVIRYLNNHSHSDYTIKLLESARNQKKFNEVLDIIFKYQNVWAKHNSPTKPELLWNYLKEVEGLDMIQLKSDFNNIDISAIVAQDRADSSTLGVTGTPEFFVNGQRLEKLDYNAFDDLVIEYVYEK